MCIAGYCPHFWQWYASPSDSVRNLSVIFDSDFSFHRHVSNICKSCFYHIRDLRRIRRHIPLSTAKTISNALIISSRLYYCNSLINNIAKQDLSKLQGLQNCLARGVLLLTITSPAEQLHWLPVNYRMTESNSNCSLGGCHCIVTSLSSNNNF